MDGNYREKIGEGLVKLVENDFTEDRMTWAIDRGEKIVCVKSRLDYDLVEAVEKEDLELMKTLLERGADSNAQYIFFLPRSTRNLNKVNLLYHSGDLKKLSEEISEKYVTKKGTGFALYGSKTPLISALSITHVLEERNLHAVKILLLKGADVNLKNVQGCSPLGQIVVNSMLYKILFGNGRELKIYEGIIEALIADGADSDIKLELSKRKRKEFVKEACDFVNDIKSKMFLAKEEDSVGTLSSDVSATKLVDNKTDKAICCIM